MADLWRLLYWNVNGLRAAHKKGFLDWLRKESPDVCCLGEIKAVEDQIPGELREIEGYHCHYLGADRPGYSGVALLTKQRPLAVRRGMGLSHFDSEGRVISADFGPFVLINTYFPNGKASAERLDYKMAFYEAFLDYLDSLGGRKVVICGDVNTAHKEIDLARPKENAKFSGFLPEERAWIDRLVSHGYLDTFRMFDERQGQYTWWDMKTGARARNVGWRIDYFFASSSLKDNVVGASIMPEVTGSDHCPISLDLRL